MLVERDSRNRVDVRRLEIGRDLEKYWRPRFAARLDYRVEQRAERALVLQRAQPRRVGARNVDRKIGGERRNQVRHLRVIGDAIGRILVRADIDPDDSAAISPCRESIRCRLAAAIVESHPVDHRVIGREAKQPRLRISGLGQGRDRAHFGKTETEAKQRVGHLAVLVEPRRHPERAGKGNPRNFGFERSAGRGARTCGKALQRLDCQPVRRFGVKREQQGPDQAEEHFAGGYGKAASACRRRIMLCELTIFLGNSCDCSGNATRSVAFLQFEGGIRG